MSGERQRDVVPKVWTGWPIETEPDGTTVYIIRAESRPDGPPVLTDRDGNRWTVSTSGRHVPYTDTP